MTSSEIENIHGKYFVSPIYNIRGIEESSFPLENCEHVHIGEFIFNVHKNDTSIAGILRSGYLYEKFYLSFMFQYIDPCKNIIDIGSNIGTHTVILCNYLINGIVYSFEPQPVVFDILAENIRINKCANSTIYNIGASSHSELCYMNAQYDIPEDQGSFCIVSSDSPEKRIQIPCIDIDTLCIENIGFIKIDVCGYEYNVLLGIKNTIVQNKPTIFIEIQNTSPTKELTLNILKEFGYTQYIQLSHCDYLFTL